MIVAVPALTPVTKPFVFTVATAPLLEVHGLLLAAVPLPSKSTVEPAHTSCGPDTPLLVMVGIAYIVTVSVTLQPDEVV